jgi:tetratricopeptide (TPR) repeat protein
MSERTQTATKKSIPALRFFSLVYQRFWQKRARYTFAMASPFRLAPLASALLCLDVAGISCVGQTVSDYDRAMVLLREGRFQQARSLFEAAARLTPDSADVWKGLGLTLLRLNDYAAAADPLRHACDLRSTGDDACYLEGRTLFLLARYDESITPLEKARRGAGQPDSSGPNSSGEEVSRIERALALSWDKLGNAREAERWFAAAIEHHRGISAAREDPRIDYGAFLVRQGRASEAVKPLGLALAANPNSYGANFETGRALLDLDRSGDALPYLERAAAIDPDSSAAQMLLGKTLLRVGRAEEGQRILAQARKRWDATNQGSSKVK